MKKSLWALGKKIVFALCFLGIAFACSLVAEQIKFGDSVRIKNVRTDNYFTAVGKEIFARKDLSDFSIFRIIADAENISSKIGQPVKYNDQVYLMLADSDIKNPLFIGKFGGEYGIYLMPRRLLGLGTKEQNPSLFKVLPGPEMNPKITTPVSYDEMIQLQTDGNAYARVNVDISTHPRGREVFLSDDSKAMTYWAIRWTKELVFQKATRKIIALPMIQIFSTIPENFSVKP